MKKLIGTIILAAMTAGCAPRLITRQYERNLSPMAKAVRLADVCYTEQETNHTVLFCEFTEWKHSDFERVSREVISNYYADWKRGGVQ
mgnify:FL=1